MNKAKVPGRSHIDPTAKALPPEVLVVEGWTEDEEGVEDAVRTTAGVTELKVDADFVEIEALLTVLLPAVTTTPEVAVAAETEVVVIVETPVDTETTVEVATVVVSGAPPGAIAMASNVGEERVAGSMHSPLKRPTRFGRQQK